MPVGLQLGCPQTAPGGVLPAGVTAPHPPAPAGFGDCAWINGIAPLPGLGGVCRGKGELGGEGPGLSLPPAAVLRSLRKGQEGNLAGLLRALIWGPE